MAAENGASDGRPGSAATLGRVQERPRRMRTTRVLVIAIVRALLLAGAQRSA
jgi:hypothetical protein